jgi:hypothetical protein
MNPIKRGRGRPAHTDDQKTVSFTLRLSPLAAKKLKSLNKLPPESKLSAAKVVSQLVEESQAEYLSNE